MAIPQLRKPRKALTCRNLAEILMPLGDKIVFSGDWAVTGLHIKPTGEVTIYGTPAEQCVGPDGKPIVRLPRTMIGKFPMGGV